MDTQRRLSAGLERIIAGRSQRIREKFAQLDAPPNAPPPDLMLHGILQDVDEATMSASFVISTQDVDRSGEVVDTAGIRTDSHELCPVALWDHGRGPIGRLPIGKCEDPQGKYTVVVRQREGIALCRIFFSQTLPFARDVFALIKEGIIRGASIGFRTIDADPMPGYSIDDEDPPLHYREIELCEISPTAVPDNARALAIKVNKAFQGRRPSSEMLKALQAKGLQVDEEQAMTQTANKPKPKVLGKSFLADMKSIGDEGKAILSKALAQITGKAADEYLQMDEDGKLEDQTVADTNKDAMNTGSLADGGAATDQSQVVDTTKADEPADDTPAYRQPLEGPPGQAAATDLHTQLGGIAESIEGWAARQDNDRIKEVLETLAQTIDQAMADIEGFHDGEYPEHPALGQTPDEQQAAEQEGESTTDDDQQTKSVRRLKAKSPARQRLEKRIKAYRTKSIKSRVVTKRLGKAASSVVTKAAGFLEKAEAHDGDWSETHKAASGFHCKALRELAKEADKPGADDADGVETKTLRAQLDKANAEAAKYRELAEKAVEQAEQVTKEWRRFKAGK